MPVFYNLMAEYPTPEALAAAELPHVVEHIQHLGLQNQRAKKIINIAQTWLSTPPQRGRRFRCLHYPKKGDGSDVRPNEILDDETVDPRVGWEVAHLPGLGAYAIDSWRIFCRDRLRDIEPGDDETIGEGEEGEHSHAEWARVLPMDKELRAFLRWRWLKAGWAWDPLTGKRTRASASDLQEAESGGVMVEGDDGQGEVVQASE